MSAALREIRNSRGGSVREGRHDRWNAQDLRVLRDRDRDVLPGTRRVDFHATYAGETVVVSIETGEVLAGTVPSRALRLVLEWAGLHRDELRSNWGRAREDAPLERIDPLP